MRTWKIVGRAAAMSLIAGGALAVAAPAVADIDAPAPGSTVTTTTPTVTGAGPVGSLITVSVDDGTAGPALAGCTAVTDAGGRWSCTVIAPLVPGVYGFVATQVSGGDVTTSAALNVTIAAAPTATPTPTASPGASTTVTITAPAAATPGPALTTSTPTPSVTETPQPTRTSLPVTAAGDAAPFLGAGLFLLVVGVSVLLWMRRLRRVHNK
jgi:hypothetical protein